MFEQSNVTETVSAVTLLGENNVTETVSVVTGSVPVYAWKVCSKSRDKALADLLPILNGTGDYPQYAYYDTKYKCYCYEYCPVWEIYPTYRGCIAMYRYLSPTIFTIGILGNPLILVMFLTKDLKNMPSKPFFQALALVDNAALICGLLVSFLHDGYGIELQHHPIACKIRMFTLYLSSSLSGWLVACLSIDRFVCVFWPMKAHVITYKHRAIATTVAFVIAAAFYSHLLVYAGHDGRACTLNTSDYHYIMFMVYYFHWVEMTLKFCIPFVVIVACNIGMVRVIKKGETSDMTTTKSETQTSKRLTILVVVIGTAFVITIMPINLMAIYDQLNQGGPSKTSRIFLRHYFVMILFRNLAHSNHAINFFLYCVVGRKFRSALTSLCGVDSGKLLKLNI